MQITGTHFNYYIVCKRKLWLFASGMNMESNSDLVYEGKLIQEKSYPQRPERYEEIEVEGIKIDFYDANNKVIHEIKKSDKIEEAHEWQVKYYIYVLEKHGIEGVSGLLEYPVVRHTAKVVLLPSDRDKIVEIEKHIIQLTESEICPEKTESRICQRCSYFEFCWSGEENE